MGPIIRLLILALFALMAGAAPQVSPGGNGNYGKFSDYCTWPMYIDKAGTSMATFDADCSSEMGGFHNIGAQLANSQLDFNDCFMNDDGKMVPHQGGKAMETCQCDIGYSVCGNDCPNTKMQCQCTNKAGVSVVGDTFDIGDYIGVTWSAVHMTYLLVCPSPNGDTVAKYQGCNKNGAFQDIQECPT